jgi:hypothetical protein
MKKIIAAIIRTIMPNEVRKHKREEKAKRIHNAVVMQTLLGNEHMIKDAVNKRFDTVYTTKKALKTSRVYGMNDYNSALALRNADFR